MAKVQNIVVLDDDGNTLSFGLFGNGSGDIYYVNTSTPRISGTHTGSVPGTTIEAKISTTVRATITDAATPWTMESNHWTTPLNNNGGYYNLSISAVGGTNTKYVKIIPDTSSVDAPTFTTADSTTFTTSEVTITGERPNNTYVILKNGATELDTDTAQGTTSWSITIPSLADGAYTLTAHAMNAYGTDSTEVQLSITVSSVAAGGSGDPFFTPHFA